MVRAPGVFAAFPEAEATRRRLRAEGRLRDDLGVLRLEHGIVFPTDEGTEYDFPARTVRPRHYSDLLDAPWAAQAPRAFDALGDILIVKVPDALWPHREPLGEAMRAFHDARAVFHDHGVQGTFRTRNLERIAGEGGSETQVTEHGARLWVDPAKAYFSPRLADERGRIAGLVSPGERFLDLFGGVAPQGVQAAKADAQVTSLDLNPEAAALARRNAEANRVAIDAQCMDAREAAGAFDRVVMNLPHGAKEFLDVAARVAVPGAMVHHHEILRDADLEARKASLIQDFAALDRTATLRHVRHVRAYSAVESHFVFDLELA